MKQNGFAEWETASSQAKRLTPEEVAMGTGEERTPATYVALLKSRNNVDAQMASKIATQQRPHRVNYGKIY